MYRLRGLNTPLDFQSIVNLQHIHAMFKLCWPNVRAIIASDVCHLLLLIGLFPGYIVITEGICVKTNQSNVHHETQSYGVSVHLVDIEDLDFVLNLSELLLSSTVPNG